MSAETLEISSQNRSALDSASTVSPIVTDVPGEQHARMLNRSSFKFHHSLGDHPSMSLPEIRKLARKMMDEKRFDQVLYRIGAPGSTVQHCDAESVDEVLNALESVETAGAWLRLTRVDEVTTRFKGILEQFYVDLSELYQQDIKSRVMKTFVTLFMSSPGAITPYHMDHTWNFLWQISGRKTVYLYDPNDTRVLLPQDKEAWYTQRAEVIQKPGATGIAYDLAAGDGVHHPVNAPHWVQNGPEVSISLSLGLCLHDSNEDAKVYQANYVLRRLGFNPTPPRTSKWRDSLKASFIGMLSDRHPSSFDDVVFSGVFRLKRFLRIVHLAR